MSSSVETAVGLLGATPTVVASAPGRANLIGEHTDYNDGFVLPFAIEQRCTAALAARDDGRVTIRSSEEEGTVTFDVDTTPGDVAGWAAYAAGVVWSLRTAGLTIGGADIAVDSQVWRGAGLSSSAAFEGAIALALDGDRVADPDDDRRTLALLLQRAENDYVGAPTGLLDQSASLRCRADHLLLMDCRSTAIEQVPLDLAAWGLTVLAIDSRTPHSHVDGEYADRRSQCEQAAAVLGVDALRDVTTEDLAVAGLDGLLRRRARHVVTENQRVLDVVGLLRGGADPRSIGPLLTASHESMRDDYEVTVPQVDVLVEAALDAGAHGARMTGGGFGGCVLALVDEGTAAEVVAATRRAAAAAGHPEPRHVAVTPSAGARVESLPGTGSGD